MKLRTSYAKSNSGRVVIENCTIGNETAKAVMVTVNGADHWIPLSQVDEIHRTKIKEQDTIVISGWIAKEKGLA